MANVMRGKCPYNMICEIAGIRYTENIEDRKISMFLDIYNLIAGSKKDYLAYIYSNPDMSVLSIAGDFGIQANSFRRIQNTIFKKMKYYVVLLLYSGDERIKRLMGMKIGDIHGGELASNVKNTGSISDIVNMTLQEYLSTPVSLVDSMKSRYILHGRLRLAGIRTDLDGNSLPLFLDSYSNMYYPVYFLSELISKMNRHRTYKLVTSLLSLRSNLGIKNLLRESLNCLYMALNSGECKYKQRCLDIFRYRYVYAMSYKETGIKLGISPEMIRSTISTKILPMVSRHITKRLNSIVDITNNGELVPLVDSSLEVLADFYSSHSPISTLTIDAKVARMFDCCSIEELLTLSNDRVYRVLQSDKVVSGLYNALEKRGYFSFTSGEPFMIKSLCPYQDEMMRIINKNGGF